MTSSQEWWAPAPTPSCTASSTRTSRRSSKQCSSKSACCGGGKRLQRWKWTRPPPLPTPPTSPTPPTLSSEFLLFVCRGNFCHLNQIEIQRCAEFYLLYWKFVEFFSIIKSYFKSDIFKQTLCLVLSIIHKWVLDIFLLADIFMIQISAPC